MKKRILFSFLCIVVSASAWSQVTIGANVKPQSFSVLELTSNQTMGLRLPQLSAADRMAVEQSPEFQAEKTGKAMGLQIFNIDTYCVETWNGTIWISVCSPPPITDPSTTDPGVIIGGTVWATRNVDEPGHFTQTPQDYGMLYQWDVNVGWSATTPDYTVDASGVRNDSPVWNSTVPGNNDWNPDPCPNGWRLPTENEILALRTTAWSYVTTPAVGWTFTDNGNVIFFPPAGYRDFAANGALMEVGTDGYYWSSTQHAPNTAYQLRLNRWYEVPNDGDRSYAQSLRCVKM